MITGLILAGGKSQRMGENKLLLPLKDSTVLGINIKKLLMVADQIIIVSGRYHEEIQSYIRADYSDLPVMVVENKAFELGMFSSVLAGIRGIDSDLVLVPGDSPFYSENTLKSLIEADGNLIVPSFRHRGGHPIVIRQPLLKRLKAMESTSNLKIFRNGQKIHWLEVEDPGILLDIDTLEDYNQYKEYGPSNS